MSDFWDQDEAPELADITEWPSAAVQRSRVAARAVRLSGSGESRMNPWILLKMKALGELVPAAGRELEDLIDEGRLPVEVTNRLRRRYGVRLSQAEVARYGSWLPEIRRDAVGKAEQRSERLVQEAKRRMREREK